MATVNKKFSVKNGLAVDGNVAVSNIASFGVTGPSSASLTFTLANVTSATINDNEIITNVASQTLTNKTIGDTLTFNDGGANQSIYANENDFHISASNSLYLNSNNADVVLQPDGQAKVGTDVIVTANASQLLSSKEFSGITQFNPVSGSQPNTGYATINYDDTDSGAQGLYIKSERGWVSPQSGGNMYITSYDDMVLNATNGNMQFFMDGGMYIGAVDSNNQIIKRSDLSLYLTEETDPVFTASAAGGITSTQVTNWDTAYGWGNHASAGYLTTFTETDPVLAAYDVYGVTTADIANWNSAYGWGNHASAGYLTTAVESISNGDDNIVFSSSTGTVTANLAANVTISNNLTVTGNLTVNGNVTTLNTETLAVEDNMIVLNTNVTGSPTLDAGIEVERGSYTNAKLYWNETSNAWHVSVPGDSSGEATDTALALAGNVTLDDAALVSANASATSGTPGVYDWDSSIYSTAKFTIQMKQGSDIHVLELLATVAGSNVYVTEYAEIISNVALGETDVTLSTGIATLTVTPVTGTVVTKIVAQLIEA